MTTENYPELNELEQEYPEEENPALVKERFFTLQGLARHTTVVYTRADRSQVHLNEWETEKLESVLRKNQHHISKLTYRLRLHKRAKKAILSYNYLYACDGDVYAIVVQVLRNHRPHNCGQTTIDEILEAVASL